jgi:hypothetical protein
MTFEIGKTSAASRAAAVDPQKQNLMSNRWSHVAFNAKNSKEPRAFL